MKNPVFTYKGIEIKYPLVCSCYYSCGDVVFWDDKRNEMFKVLENVDEKEAQVIMDGWISHAPSHIYCTKLEV